MKTLPNAELIDGVWYLRRSDGSRARCEVAACEWCGEDFLNYPSRHALHCSRQCSSSCRQAGRHGGNPGRGLASTRWKGGFVHRRGYAFVWMPDHPALAGTTRKYMAEHRLVMEEVLGRYLERGEQVHHKNGDKLDNRPENLELWMVQQPAGQRATEIKHCPTCQCNEESS